MKFTSGHKMLAAALIAGVSSFSFAATSNTAPYMGMMGTYLFPDQDRFVDDGFGGTLLFGFPVNAYFAPELNLYGLRANRDYTDGKDKMWGGGVNFNIFPFSSNLAVAPFISIGGGAEYDRSLAFGNETNAVAHAGGGLLIALNKSRTVQIRLEGGRYGIFDDSVNSDRNYILDTRVSAGVQFALGGRAAPVPVPAPPAPVVAPAPEPAPAPVIAPAPPRDSDGDGVLDNADECPNTPAGMKVDEKGCAIKAATIVLRDINFEVDKSVLTAQAQASLNNIVAGLKGQPSMNLQIDGHTDSTASDAYNLKLSKSRAAAAKKYLVDAGIDASRLQSEGYGEGKPVATNTTAAGRAENRRVEFKVIK